jgi:hypothetical protein
MIGRPDREPRTPRFLGVFLGAEGCFGIGLYLALAACYK